MRYLWLWQVAGEAMKITINSATYTNSYFTIKWDSSNKTDVIENLEGRNAHMMISIKDSSSEKEQEFNNYEEEAQIN